MSDTPAHPTATPEKDFIPAQVFHAAEMIAEEARSRGWTLWDFTERIGSLDQPLEVLGWELYAACASAENDETRVSCHMSDDNIMDLERVFGISAHFWRATEALWRAHPDQHTPLSDEAMEWYGLNDEVESPELPR